MSKTSLLNQLPPVQGRYTENTSMATITWLRVGGPAEVLFKPKDKDDLIAFLQRKPQDVPITIFGVGSNVLVREAGIPGVVIRLGRGFIQCRREEGNTLLVGAGCLDRSVSQYAMEQELGGLEFLSGIPGTIGGALRMNAGAYGREMKDILVSATAVDPNGTIHSIPVNEMNFSHRFCGIPDKWIFLDAHLQGIPEKAEVIKAKIQEIMSTRETSQPTRARTGGCTFTNPDPSESGGLRAWELIDQAGCRGLKIGGALISEQHCNFLINTGAATASDLEKLVHEVHQRVLKNSGINLRMEIQLLGQEKK
ncbi:MAG: UDP-N-acetylmuramate dehydrogenase [Alphaproteobacteria bacterium]|jgi:UDP-N-acetylmuramate dehydrogenase|nr:UDP-N-acetylmuramate dehydrogenase [Alphaproteobacteria bacterium]MBT5389998.1 UDP-N-acetylmuramate dehydrogenase [Alphaproteobacteria bacterium]MBT5540573.1 UDP-N-acetylmuramate dehydrogenase [Alphaproteobacteria bacterium]MBT5654202.1 UDP-N-acetylmuramate dehydrogenase [Alphaproteobacteria bacterium]